MRQREIQALEGHIRTVPEDARRAACCSPPTTRDGRTEEAMREANLGVTLRPNEATVLYNAACVFCQLGRKAEGMAALKKAWDAGSSTPTGAARPRPRAAPRRARVREALPDTEGA
jgi:non-specific serine/threonine protein kinase